MSAFKSYEREQRDLYCHDCHGNNSYYRAMGQYQSIGMQYLFSMIEIHPAVIVSTGSAMMYSSPLTEAAVTTCSVWTYLFKQLDRYFLDQSDATLRSCDGAGYCCASPELV